MNHGIFSKGSEATFNFLCVHSFVSFLKRHFNLILSLPGHLELFMGVSSDILVLSIADCNKHLSLKLCSYVILTHGVPNNKNGIKINFLNK